MGFCICWIGTDELNPSQKNFRLARTVLTWLYPARKKYSTKLSKVEPAYGSIPGSNKGYVMLIILLNI